MSGKNTDVRHVIPVRAYVWRFFTGAHMDGYRRTNATFVYKGDRVLGGIVKAGKWAYRPGYQRMLIRWAWLLGFFMLTIGQFVWPTFTHTVVILAVIALVAKLGRRAYKAIATFQLRRKWIVPLHKPLSGIIGVKQDVNPTDYIFLPANFQDDPDVRIRIDLPDDFVGSENQDRKAVTGLIQAKLAMPDAEVKYNLQSDTPHMVVTRAPAPPDKVSLKNAREAIEKASDSAPFLGYGPRKKAVHVKLDDESPHILVSAGPGGGKSVLLRLILAQGLAKGATGIICDVKRVSQSWAKGLPRVDYHRTPEQIHDAVIELAKEGERRYDVIDDEGEDAGVGPRIFLLLEEMNATMSRLQKYWDSIREPGQPKRSPAVDAIGDLLFMGRACRIHVIAVAQMATARTMGGPEMRENFATRIIARYSPNAWKMLTDIWPAPKSSRHAGRVQVYIAGETTETQIVFLTGEEARKLALEGGGEATEEIRRAPKLTLVTEPGIKRYTLQEACKAEVIPMNYDAIRQARRRDKEFPSGEMSVDGIARYTAEELVKWHLNRERAEKRA